MDHYKLLGDRLAFSALCTLVSIPPSPISIIVLIFILSSAIFFAIIYSMYLIVEKYLEFKDRSQKMLKKTKSDIIPE